MIHKPGGLTRALLTTARELRNKGQNLGLRTLIYIEIREAL